MNKKVIFAVLLFGLFGLIYGSFLAVQESTAKPAAGIAPIPTYMPPERPQTSLWFKQDVEQINASGNVPVDVYINTKENRVRAVTLYISYDPKVLRVDSIKNVGLLSGKQVIEKKIDTVSGMISFTVRNTSGKDIPPIQGSDRIAEVVFTPIDRTTATSLIKIHPSTMIEAEGIKHSAAVKTQDIMLQLKK